MPSIYRQFCIVCLLVHRVWLQYVLGTCTFFCLSSHRTWSMFQSPPDTEYDGFLIPSYFTTTGGCRDMHQNTHTNQVTTCEPSLNSVWSKTRKCTVLLNVVLKMGYENIRPSYYFNYGQNNISLWDSVLNGIELQFQWINRSVKVTVFQTGLGPPCLSLPGLCLLGHSIEKIKTVSKRKRK